MSEGIAAKPNSKKQQEDKAKINRRMSRIRHKVIVLSGKGGVGKSTVAVNLAVSLAQSGRSVGLLDVDIHGPSIPIMLGLDGVSLSSNGKTFEPISIGNLKAMSIGFLIQNEDEALIWRGPMKMGVIKQLLGDVEWGELDYLIIDNPPGTGDEPLSICQLIENPDGAIIVTTPQRVAAIDVRKALTFCRELKLPILGIVENMSGFSCPKCGEVVEIFPSGGGRKIAVDFNVPFLGSLPIDPAIGIACDAGTPFVQHYEQTETAGKFKDIIAPILALSEREATAGQQTKEGRINENSHTYSQ
ncbi:Mrp/NBP35 family ATP-binding protein [Pontiella sulfatireligans]|uniref:Iron-sulfur cluster carrier protein n=1 Tax=Pontiella sulfatireligans TaxID=2750658 RepID=A0A6C2UID2_9BACT|nr:Mrp/NBP35 family ATP-binding protein [Pontiella sulfatireligans]VGO19950.1 Iron-sulfur cluster carrier protein [Pontiella sulfatireligans]